MDFPKSYQYRYVRLSNGRQAWIVLLDGETNTQALRINGYTGVTIAEVIWTGSSVPLRGVAAAVDKVLKGPLRMFRRMAAERLRKSTEIRVDLAAGAVSLEPFNNGIRDGP